MRYVSTLLVCLLIPVISKADPYLLAVDLVCDDTEKIFAALTSVDEIPIAIAQADDVVESKVLLWSSKKEESWTLTATKGKETCVIGYGKNFKLISLRKTDLL